MKELMVLGGMIGLVVGDALGVPVEFESRAALRADPVTGPRGGGRAAGTSGAADML